MKSILFISILALIIAGCHKTHEQPTPPPPNYTTCKISIITLVSCPLTDINGNPWDYLSNPDFYVNIELANGSIISNGQSGHQNDRADFPQWWNLMPPWPIAKTDWDINYRIAVYDYDTPDPDDYVGAANFTISNYAADYPSTIDISDSGVQIRLNLSWE